jgi:phosphoribosyl-ATP pyrophosphohydrolase
MSEHILDRLYAVVDARKGADLQSSYTAKLLDEGPKKIGQKVGEEAVEAVIEGVSENRDGLISESADLLYHLLVLWSAIGVKPEDVWAELARREGLSGIEEKARRLE